MAKKVKKSEVVAAVKELNELLGLDPQIETTGKNLNELKELSVEAAGLIEPSDEVTDETRETLNALLEEAGAEPLQVPEAPAQAEEAAQEEEEEEAPPEVIERRPGARALGITRIEAIGKTLKKAKENGMTVQEAVQAADDLFVAHGGTSNPKESRTLTGYAIKALMGFGAVEVVEGDVIQ